MNNTCILVPVTDIRGVKSRDQLTLLMGSLVDYKDFDIMLCFDACDPEFIRYFQEKYDFFESVINTGNRLNFSRNVNTGLRKVIERNQNVILCNQDCKAPPQRLVQESLCQFVGICNPLCTPELELPEGDGLINEYDHKVAFYFTFIHNDVLQKVGLLDGVFKRGGFDDDEYCIRAKLAGFKIYVANIYVYHEGSYIDSSNPNWTSASGSYNAADLGLNGNICYTKYQCPGDVPHDQLMKWCLENHKWVQEMKIS